MKTGPTMMRLWQTFLFATLLVITAAGCSTPHRPGAEAVAVNAFRERDKSIADIHDARPSGMEVEARLMGYADRYLSKVAEATDIYQHAVHTKAARELGLATFIFPGLTVIGIAADGEPGADLLDMVVFATLQRESLENGWAKEVLGDHADNLLKTQRQLETQAWEIAKDVLATEQLDRLRYAITAWRKANPGQRYVSNVRFDDVAASRGLDQSTKRLEDESEGLLAPLDAAVREGEEIRLMAKRSMYLIQRMPPLLMAQARFVLHEEVSPEQVDGLLKDISGFRAAVEGAQKTLTQIPQNVHQEREALFNDLGKVSPVLEQGQALTKDINALLNTFKQIEDQYPATGAVINETLREYRELAKVMDQSPASDMGPKIELLREVAHVGSELNQLARELNGEESLKLRTFLNDFINGLLIRAMLFALFVFGLAVIYRHLGYASQRGGQ